MALRRSSLLRVLVAPAPASLLITSLPASLIESTLVWCAWMSFSRICNGYVFVVHCVNVEKKYFNKVHFQACWHRLQVSSFSFV